MSAQYSKRKQAPVENQPSWEQIFNWMSTNGGQQSAQTLAQAQKIAFDSKPQQRADMGGLASLAMGSPAAAAGPRTMQQAEGVVDGASRIKIGNPARGNIDVPSFLRPRVNEASLATLASDPMANVDKYKTAGWWRTFLGDQSNALNNARSGARESNMMQQGLQAADHGRAMELATSNNAARLAQVREEVKGRVDTADLDRTQALNIATQTDATNRQRNEFLNKLGQERNDNQGRRIDDQGQRIDDQRDFEQGRLDIYGLPINGTSGRGGGRGAASGDGSIGNIPGVRFNPNGTITRVNPDTGAVTTEHITDLTQPANPAAAGDPDGVRRDVEAATQAGLTQEPEGNAFQGGVRGIKSLISAMAEQQFGGPVNSIRKVYDKNVQPFVDQLKLDDQNAKMSENHELREKYILNKRSKKKKASAN